MDNPVDIVQYSYGPSVPGTRITVYDILDYVRMGWHHTTIAATLRISSPQVLGAVKYIEEHKDAVLAEYQEMLDRDARGNPPEIQAKLDAIHAKYQVLWADKLKRAGLLDEDHASGNGRQ